MATFQTDEGDLERPLIFTDPAIARMMAGLRDMIVAQQGEAGHELVGLRAGENGGWVGVFRKAPDS